MKKFEERFLDDIRDRLAVSTVVSRHLELKKEGTEWKALSPFNTEKTPSFTVVDQKGFWHDFSSGKHGDIFAFEQEITGCTFPRAVEILADLAGIPMPSDSGSSRKVSSSPGRDHASERPARSTGDPPDRQDDRAPKKRREIKTVYDYTDAQGALIYQVVRFEPKSFAHRRPNPREAGTFIWGLDVKDDDGAPLQFMRKGPGASWARFDQKKFTEWHYADRGEFPDLDNVTHGLFNFVELAAEIGLPDDRRTIHITEGEKDCQTLIAWGFLATTNSGGARHWGEHLAEMFRGCDVILHTHNDLAGRERIAKMAPMLLAVDARVRVCDPSRFHDGFPEKGDITDWRDKFGGTADRLYEIIDTPLLVPDWVPEPYRSKLGAVRWHEQYNVDRPKYEWTIRDIVPRRRTVLIFGDSQVGKSFEAFDMAMSIARGIDFGGRRTRRGGVIYIAAEKGAGFLNRMIAYRMFHEIAEDVRLPIAVLTRRINIWLDEKMIDVIAEECREIAKEWDVPLEAIVFDTHNAATSGASEIKSEEVTLLKDRYETLIEKTGASVWIVHHKNAQGHLRGSLILYNAIETAIELHLVTDKHTGDQKDDAGRIIRRASIRKQSEGAAGLTWDFVLRVVKVGVDEYGDQETSCVTDAPDRPESQEDKKTGERAKSPGAFHLNKGEVAFFQALLSALKKAGIPPPMGLDIPASVPRAVLWNDFTRAYRQVVPNDEGTDDAAITRYKARIKKAMERARGVLMNFRVIGIAQMPKADDGTEGQHVLWPTGKPVWGQGLQWPPPKAKPKEDGPVIDAVTGQEITSIDDPGDKLF